MPLVRIPLNKPSLWGDEWRCIQDAVRRGQISGDGHYTKKCANFLGRLLRVPRVFLTPSCTHALEMAFLLTDYPGGSEVLLPSFTFPSTANAFVLRGLRPKFVEIRPDTLNIDESRLEAACGAKTRAVVPVHYAGVPCDMDKILAVARRRRLDVIEDAAQALGATWKGRAAGTFGRFGAFSFHETKNITCGEGGALTASRRPDILRAEIIRQKGTDRERYYRGEVDKYSWVDTGSSYVPSELQTAWLYAQLEHLNDIHTRRKKIHERYDQALEPYQRRGRLKLPVIPPGAGSSYHLFYVVFGSEKERNGIMEGLRKDGILSVFHFVPLHLSAMGRKYGYARGDFPISERVGAGLLRLPFYNTLTPRDQDFVIQRLKKLLDRRTA